MGKNKGLLDDPELIQLAESKGRTPAQIVLRWHMQSGIVAIPKSVTRQRIRENIDIFDFELEGADMETFAGLNRNRRLGPHPNEFDLV